LIVGRIFAVERRHPFHVAFVECFDPGFDKFARRHDALQIQAIMPYPVAA
jgi:hypothetical protein